MHVGFEWSLFKWQSIGTWQELSLLVLELRQMELGTCLVIGNRLAAKLDDGRKQ
jgi:hypothetical protein